MTAFEDKNMRLLTSKQQLIVLGLLRLLYLTTGNSKLATREIITYQKQHTKWFPGLNCKTGFILSHF